ncbi:MAG: AAA family ATPase, partial [Candidatus Omnitrophica bacterium]|nr:AAA family ATPase [Candidatus Omnitrophota bacterium]
MTQSHSSQEDTLFSIANKELIQKFRPLSVRMRPGTLEEIVGQRHLLQEGKILTRAITADRLTSVIFYGPPGVGKTTLAFCISKKTKAYFEKVNAVSANVADLRKIITASQRRFTDCQKKTV